MATEHFDSVVGSPSKPVAKAYRVPQGVDSTHADPPKRSTLFDAINAIVVAVLLCVIAHNAANANSTASSAEEAMEGMAWEILKLSKEVDSANHLALLLEEEGKAIKEELKRDRGLIKKLEKMEEEDRDLLRKKEKEIQDLMADVRSSAGEKKWEEEGKNKLRGGATGSVERVMTEMKGKLTDVRQAIQADDRSIIESTFGPGPHRVKIVLDFPPGAPEGESDEGNEASADSFTIEMAPLDLMPHSVRVFLQQVDAGLWDNCRFYRNAKHIVQAEPLTTEGDFTPEERFVEEKLEHVSFQEYSDDFPHLPYTVGFAGLPGGPKWYINKVDNTEVHGPGGQAKFQYWKTEAEPCFGKVVSGFSVVERLGRMHIDGTDPTERMREYVRIVSAAIVQET